jgi:hypothetical protein
VATLALCGLLFCAARFAGNGISFAMADRQIARDLTVLDAIPRGSQLVTLLSAPCLPTPEWALERRTHIAGLALARRHAFANDQWEIPGGQLLRIHNREAGRFDRNPSQLTFYTACTDGPATADAVARIPAAIPYLWVVDVGRPRPFAGWRAIRVAGGSAVYVRDRSPVPAASE